jgi:hypothetical protein
MSQSRKSSRALRSALHRRPRLELLEDRSVPATLFVDDDLIAGTLIGNLAASVDVTDDRDNSGTLSTGDQVSITVGGTTTADLTFNAAVNTGEGDTASAYGSIQAAIDASLAGDTIAIAPGNYAESVSVSKALTLDGLSDAAGDVTIDSASEDGITISASGVTINDLEVTGSAAAGISASGITSLTLDNVLVNTSAGAGLSLTGTGATGTTLTLTDVSVSGNTGAGLTVSGFETVDLSGLSSAAGGAVQSSISLPSALSGATLNIGISGSTPTTFTVTGTTLEVHATGSPAGEVISLANVDSLNLTGGTGVDTFVVTQSASGGPVITINGGNPGLVDGSGTTGDILDLSATAGLTVNATAAAAGFSGTITGNSNPTINFSGIEQFTDGTTISGQVTDQADAAVPGVTVQIDAGANGSVDLTTVTDASGNYSVTGLPPGTYRVRIVLPGGATQLSSDPSDSTVSLGQNVSGVNFQIQTTASVGGTVSGVVYNDANNNGTQDSGETIISNATVFLDANGNGTLDSGELSDVADGSGAFSITATANGTFTLRAVLPSGFASSTTASVNLNGGNSVTSNVGLRPVSGTPGGIVSGVVFNDTDGDGTRDSGEAIVSNVVVFLDANANGTLDSGELADTSDGSGAFSITAATNGTFTVRAILPSGFASSTTASVSLNDGSSITSDVGLRPATGTTGGTVSGVVYTDTDHDGIRDSGEATVSNAVVFLDANGNSTLDAGELSDTTDASGAFSITSNANGLFTLRAVLPSGFSSSTTAAINLSGGNTVTSNVGLRPASASTGGTVTGFVFADVNPQNNTRDAGESGVRNVTVWLDLDGDGKLDSNEPTDVTDGNGAFSLTTTTNGTFSVRAVLSPGYIRSSGFPSVTLTGGSTTSTNIGLFTNLPPQATPARRLAAGYIVGGQAHVKTFRPDGSEDSDTVVFPGLVMRDVRVAVADVTGDGVEDVIVGTGPGVATRVVVLDGTTLQIIATLTPFESSFTGGVFVAAGDVTGDGIADIIITPDEGGGPRVIAFQGGAPGATGTFTQVASFFGIDDSNFRGGCRVSVADVNRDGIPDVIVAAGFGGGPRIAVFNGDSILSGSLVRLFNDFFIFEQSVRNGAFIAAGDVDGDGFADIIGGGGPTGGPRVLVLSGADLMAGKGNASQALANFFADDDKDRGGIRLAAKDTDGDGRVEIFTGSGNNKRGKVKKFNGNGSSDNFDFDFDSINGVFVG